jgi:hypothetical protein
VEHAFRIVTISLVLAGISIFAYIGSLVVEAIARGVIGGLWAERRRRRAIDALRDHYLDDDADNPSITLSVRAAHPRLVIVARFEQLLAPRETLAR